MSNEDIKSIVRSDRLYMSYFILGCSILISLGFAYWLYSESNIEKLRDYRFEYNMLILHDRGEEIDKFRSDRLASIYDEEIDKIWWPVIRDEADGYSKLQLYSRLLAGNPDHERIYMEIAATLEKATEEFSINERTKYLTSIKNIKGIHNVLLEKYGLVVTSD